MTPVRRARPDDAAELVRLRAVMLAGVLGREPAPGEWRWRDNAAGILAAGLADPMGTMAAYVVDRPDDAGGLAACVVGLVEDRLPSPANPTGEVGHVLNVATDPPYRRRGYARACMRALLDWYRARGVVRVELRSSGDGEQMYAGLGFTRTRTPLMQLDLPAAAVRVG